MAFGLVVPGVGAAPAQNLVGVQIQRVNPETKISPELWSAFAENQYVSYLVTLVEQADTARAAAVARTTALRARTADPEVAARVGVIRTLQQTADNSQASLTDYLENRREQGLVRQYKSYYIVNALLITSTEEVMTEVAARPDVARLWPDTTRQLAPIDEPQSGPSIQAEAGGAQWNIAKIEAPSVWEMGFDGTGVVIATLDTGVDWLHPALTRQWRGYDAGAEAPGELTPYSWYDAVNGSSLPYDDNAHGTHVTGTMVGVEPDGSNKIGVAPGAKWIGVKILSGDGRGNDSWIMDGAQWVLAPGGDASMAPDIVNNSWGAGPGMDEYFRGVVQAWRDAGIFPAFAAGNVAGDATVGAPGNYPESFAVGATDINDELGSFSSCGPAPYDAPNDMKPEVTAPGVSIRSSVPDGGYEYFDGTSMACPHVSGAVALLLQAKPDLTVDEIEQILKETADPREDERFIGVPNYGYGWGRLNIFGAVSKVAGGTSTLQGQVSTGGEDLDEPAVVHEPLITAYTGIDTPVYVEASDAVSVVSVEVFMRPEGQSAWTIVPCRRVAGDYLNGLYKGNIPGDLLAAGQIVEYYVRVNDFGNNTVVLPVSAFTVETGVKPGYAEGFEGSPQGWRHGGPNDYWEVGTPSYGPGGAHGGERAYGTDLDDQYPVDSNSWLEMPPIDLTGGEPAKLAFWHWYDLEWKDPWVFDTATVQVSANGRDWSDVAAYSQSSSDWKLETIDLTPYQGQVVRVRFLLQSDGEGVRAGWYIDDVVVVGPDEVPPGAPSDLAVRPATYDDRDYLPGDMILTWAPPSDLDVLQYRVYTVGDGDIRTLIGTTKATTFTDLVPFAGTNRYSVAAVDLGGNEGAGAPAAEVGSAARTTIIYDDFESGENGWAHGGVSDSWELGTPANGPEAAHSGSNLWATDLDGNYGDGAYMWLMSPEIDLTEYQSASLGYWFWCEMESWADFAGVEISTDDGMNWTRLIDYSSDWAGMHWSQAALDISSYAGQKARVRFLFTSDDWFNDYPGFYVDDFRVVGWRDYQPIYMDSASAREPGFGEARPHDEVHLDAKEAPKAESVQLFRLPVSATVMVLETGKIVRTDPATGNYTLTHKSGTYTVEVAAYGYYSDTQQVELAEDTTATRDFTLTPIPKAPITGVVRDQQTGLPISGAQVYLSEDPRITPEYTGAEGDYGINALIGDYTAHVTARGYYAVDIPVSLDVTGVVLDVDLRPFVGNPAGEMVYDDGTVDGGICFPAAGSGAAVRMSPRTGAAQINTVSFLLYPGWPSPGSESFEWAIYDATGLDNSPGALLYGPFEGKGVRDGQWTVLDVSGQSLLVSGDYYVAYFQSADPPHCPAISVDENPDGVWYDRTWICAGGTWQRGVGTNGMIRSSVVMAVDIPMITEPAGLALVNQEEITVRGSASPGATVTIYVDGVPAANVVSDNGEFTAQVTLAEGENTLTADAGASDGSRTSYSPPVVVDLDTVAPELSLLSPQDNAVTNRDSVRLVVAAQDEHLSGEMTITAVGYESVVTAQPTDGRCEWAASIPLAQGLNTFTLEARDHAGNATQLTYNITKDVSAPVLISMAPSSDQELRTGDTVTIAFDSESGLTAGYMVDASAQSQAQDFEPLMESLPGHYEAQWKVPSGFRTDGAVIRIRARDAAGNVTEVEAPGKIRIASADVIELDRIPGEYATNGKDGVASGKRFLVSGRVLAGFGISTVRVAGRRVRVANDGKFSYSCLLREGINRIVVEIPQTSGAVTTREYTVRLDSHIALIGLRARKNIAGQMEVTGRTDPGAQVLVEILPRAATAEPTDWIEGRADSSGHFSLTGAVGLPRGYYRVRVTVTDDMGNRTSRNASLTIR
jgi:bacillopeptidase F